MNAVLHLQGSDTMIVKTLKQWRRQGIPFINCEADPHSDINKGLWYSSREIIQNRIIYHQELLMCSDFYCFVRERDVEMAVISSHASAKLYPRTRTPEVAG